MCRGDTRNAFSKTQLLSRRSCHDTVNFCKLGLPPTRMRAGWSVWSKKRPWTVNRVPPMMLPLDGETPVTSGQGTNILLLNNALNKVQVHYHSEQTSLHLTYLHKSGSWRAFPNPKPWIISSLVNSLKCIYKHHYSNCYINCMRYKKLLFFHLYMNLCRCPTMIPSLLFSFVF